jgi:hypothetical protein
MLVIFLRDILLDRFGEGNIMRPSKREAEDVVRHDCGAREGVREPF